MAAIESLVGPGGQRLALALMHFLWQGTLLAAAQAVWLWLLRGRGAPSRHAACLLALLAMAAAPAVTFWWLAPVGELAGASDESVAGAPEIATAALPSAGMPVEFGDIVGEDVLRGPAVWRARLAGLASQLPPCFLAGWALGVGVLSLRLAVGFFGVRRWLAQRRPVPAALLAGAARLGKRLGLRRMPVLALSERVGEAMAIGLWRPVILLPACWLARTTPDVLEAVIAHELAHVRRFDLGVNALQRLVETVLFYHPAVWWVSRRLRVEREMCCDALAVAATGQRLAYVRALEALAHQRHSPPVPSLGAAIGGKKMALLNRVRSVLGLAPRQETSGYWPAGLAAVLAPLAMWFALPLALPAGEKETPLSQEPSQSSPAPGSPKPEQADAYSMLPKAYSSGSPADRLAAKPLPPAPARSGPAEACNGVNRRMCQVECRFVREDGTSWMAPRIVIPEGESACVADCSQSPFVTSVKPMPNGATEPRIHVLDEGLTVRVKLLEDRDGMVNVDATVEVSRIGDVAIKTAGESRRQAPRWTSNTTRVIESLAFGEKLSIPLELPVKKPRSTILEGVKNSLLGAPPSNERPRVAKVELTVSQLKPQRPETIAPAERLKASLQRPQPQVLNYVKFLGCKEARRKVLEKEVGLKQGDAIDPGAVAEGRCKIEDYYRSQGLATPHVAVLDGDRPGDAGAIYVIDEQPGERVLFIGFRGNTFASDERLRAIVQATPGALASPGLLARKRLDADLSRLTTYHRWMGFFQVKVGREIEFDDAKDRMTVTFVIDQGPRYTVRNVVVRGNTRLSTEELSRDMKLTPGKFFNQHEMIADVTRMRDLYGSVGYAFAQVKQDVRFDEEPGVLDLVYSIQEQAPAKRASDPNARGH